MNDRRKVLELFENEEMNRKMQANIETYRKGDAKITVVDENGAPLKNVTVKVDQRSHEFRFGANIFMLDELESDEKNEIYKKYFADVFNMATLPFYWKDLEPVKGQTRYAKDSPKIYRRPATDLCIEFCEEHGIEPREHALAYEQFFPAWLSGLDTPTVKKEIERRFSEIAERYADKIPTIEVTNEMFWWKGITDFYHEPDYVEWCFKTARKYFPNNNLSINDGGNFAYHKDDPYLKCIKDALEKGAPIDSVGTQFHMHFPMEKEYEQTRNYYNPELVYRNLDKYGELGKLQITEITIPAYTEDPEDEEIQAELIEKMYTVWFSHPQMEQIVYWNLIDGYAYVANPTQESIRASQGDMTLGENIYRGGLLHFDLTPKAAYYKIKELTQKTWHTADTLTTDENGKLSFRGFYGDYAITVEKDGKTYEKQIKLSSKENGDFTVVI